MIAGAVTRNFGILASDSAQYDTSQGKMTFQSLKVFFNPKYLMTFLGTPAYFSKLDAKRMVGDMQMISIYLKDYLRKIRPEVEKVLSSAIADPDENKAHFCFLIMGVHRGLPTVAQFNSFKNFEPTYTFTKDKDVKFVTIHYGDDNPAKKKLFQESSAYMEEKAARLTKEEIAPGRIGEIITRGIYRKADAEEKILKKKYAGGIVNAACILKNGAMFPLSSIQQA